MRRYPADPDAELEADLWDEPAARELAFSRHRAPAPSPEATEAIESAFAAAYPATDDPPDHPF